VNLNMKVVFKKRLHHRSSKFVRIKFLLLVNFIETLLKLI